MGVLQPIDDLLAELMVLSCWVGYRNSGHSARDADRLAGEQMGRSPRTVQRIRIRFEETCNRWPSAKNAFERLTEPD